MRSPETQKLLTAMGAEVDIKTGEEMRKIIPSRSQSGPRSPSPRDAEGVGRKFICPIVFPFRSNAFPTGTCNAGRCYLLGHASGVS